MRDIYGAISLYIYFSNTSRPTIIEIVERAITLMREIQKRSKELRDNKKKEKK